MTRRRRGLLIDVKVRRDLWSIRGRLLGLVLIIASGVAILYGIGSALADLRQTSRGVLHELRAADLEVRFTAQAASALPDLSTVPGVSVVQPRLLLPATVELPRDRTLSSLVVFQPPGQPPLNRLRLLSGRLARAGQDEIVIDRALRDEHGYELGDAVRVASGGTVRSWQVVGVAVSPEFLVTTTNPDYVIPTPGSLGVLWADAALARAWGADRTSNSLLLGFKPGSDADEVSAAVLRALDAAPSPPRVDEVVPQDEAYSASSTRMDLEAFGAYSPAIVWTLVVLSLVLGVLTFHRFVVDKRTELGVLTALGYPRRRIRLALVRAGLAVGLVGGLTGLLIGAAVGRGFAEVYASSMNLPFLQSSFSWAWAATALAVGVGGGALMLLLASARALSTPTRDLLTPLVAAASAGAAGGGRTAGLPVAVRYALRTLWRERRVTGIGVLAMAASVAVAVSYGLAVSSTFGTVGEAFEQERWQYAVDLSAPAPLPVVEQRLRAVPAVRDVEPYVRTSAGLEAGDRRADASLVGVAAPSRLHVVRPSRGREVRDDAETVLSADLARDLRVGLGDDVRLTKGPLDWDARVVGITDDMYLRTFTVTLAAGQALTGAPEAVTGAYVQGDARVLDVLEPGVADIAVLTDKAALIRHFEQQMAETMGIVYIAVGFSVGVSILFVTTLVHLSIAERRDEFAVLLALGFSSRRLRGLILTSVAAQVLSALVLSVPLALLLARYLNSRMAEAWFAVDLHLSWTAFLWPMLAALLVAPVIAVLGSRATAQMRLTEQLRSRAA